MRVIVLGSGIVGVTSAYYLAGAGHEVTVVDRQPGPSLETSHANAAQISPGGAGPWAVPGIVRKSIGWMLMRHPPLVLRRIRDQDAIRWLLASLGNCTARRYAVNKERMVRLAVYSRQQLIELRAATRIAYDSGQRGTLQLFRTEAQVAAAHKDMTILKQSGVSFELLDVAGCIAAEPALHAAQNKFVGGLRWPSDETGDCFKFSAQLTEIARQRGVAFRFGETVKVLNASGNRISNVQTDRALLTADAYVVALGSYSPRMLAPLGIRLPVYPVKGYSITAKVIDSERAPLSTIMDETYKIAITRLGDRIRVGGIAEISGFSHDLPARRRDALIFSVRDLFPDAGDFDGAIFWTGLRPMTPDGPPVIGGTDISNLFINCGHGTLGWTMACGSAHVIADVISGHATDIEVADLSIERYH